MAGFLAFSSCLACSFAKYANPYNIGPQKYMTYVNLCHIT